MQANGVADNPPPRTAMQIKRQSQRFSKLHLSFFASAVCNNVD